MTGADPSLLQVVSERGLLSAEALARAVAVQEESGERLDAVLTRLGLVSDRALADTLAAAAGLTVVEPADFPAEAVAADALAPRFLRAARAAPLRWGPEGIEVAFVDPFQAFDRDAIAFALGRPVTARVGRAGDVEAALDRLYGPLGAAAGVAAAEEADEADLERLKDLASDAPVVRAVNGMIARAAEARASDIHLEPLEDGVAVRFRIDGALEEQERLPASMRAALVSRVKVLAGLNIAERRLPQDGRMRVAVRGHEIDLRVATCPSLHGELVVLRLLDRSQVALDFVDLGFDADLLARFRETLRRPHGIVLVTGPTGSGKTTTLYTALSELRTGKTKILTVEDPIEYRLDGVSQTQVQPQIGLDFASALRAFLRLNPNIIMVGEIRDLETAQIAVQASLTGHMLLSTLHTNSAAAAVTRLLDMGLEPYLITATLNAVLAQRLVRRLCAVCRAPHPDPAGEFRAFGLPAPEDHELPTLWEPAGCPACSGTGFRGRIAILELLTMTEETGALTLARGEAREIERAAVRDGMRTMLQDGIAKALAGETTLAEVLLVTREA